MCGIFATLPINLNIMKYKNILVKELYSRKYRNRIKRSKKGRGSYVRVKRVRVEIEWEGKNKRVKENKI